MRMESVKRASCLFLAATCVFLTGCHSILYDGNLHFKSYEPETVPLLYDEVSNEVNTSSRELDADRFNVDGTDAFFILPCHENDPGVITDFKVLDYTDAGTFIYAYVAAIKDEDDPLGGYPYIGQVLPNGGIGPATIDMLGDRTVPLEPVGTSAGDPDETLPAPVMQPVSEEVVDVKSESSVETGNESFLDGEEEGDVMPFTPQITPEESYTFDPGEFWWGEDFAGGTMASPEDTASSESTAAAPDTARQDDVLWWDTGESEGIGHVDWASAEAAAAAQESYNQVSREEASREQASREAASREAASRSSADMSEWWNESSQAGDYNEPAGETTSVAAETAEVTVSPAELTGIDCVTILMAYDPQRRVYKVFYAGAVDWDAKLTQDAETGEWEYNPDEDNSGYLTLSANKLAKSEEYFIYFDKIGYIFDRDGNQIYKNDYSAVIPMAVDCLKERAAQNVSDPGKLTWTEPTVSNVVMDGYHCVYLPISVEASETPEEEPASLNEAPTEPDPNNPTTAPAAAETTTIDYMEMDPEVADEALESVTYSTVLISMDVDIGGNDPDIKFYSENDYWGVQQEKWLSYDGEEITDDDVTKDTLSDYLKSNGWDMESIKAGNSLYADHFSAFHTEGSDFDLTLAYLPDIYSFYSIWSKDTDAESGSEVIKPFTVGSTGKASPMPDAPTTEAPAYLDAPPREAPTTEAPAYLDAPPRETPSGETPTTEAAPLPTLEADECYVLMCLRDLAVMCNTNYSWHQTGEEDLIDFVKEFIGDYVEDKDDRYGNFLLWRTADESKLGDELYRRAIDALALCAMGDPNTLKRGNLNSVIQMQVPWMTPGTWDASKGTNESPLPDEVKNHDAKIEDSEKDHLEAILAFHQEWYPLTGSSDQYIPIYVAHRSEKKATIRYSMIPVEWTEKQTRTFTQTIEKQIAVTDTAGNPVLDSSGNPTYRTETTTNTYTETIDRIPTKYQFLFPAETKLSVTMMRDIEMGTMVAPTGDTGAIFYEDDTPDASGEEDADADASVTSRLIVSVIGQDVFKCDKIPGRASDAGILYHKSASGKETELMTLITDEGVQFVLQGSGAAGSGQWWQGGEKSSGQFFISSDEFATRTTNYGLYTISTSEFNKLASAAIKDGVSDAQNQVIQEKMNTGAGMDALMIDNFALLNEREVLASSVNEGLFIVNLQSHQTVSLRAGAFFSAFSYHNKDGSERFMVVGFDTTQYYYQPTDIAKAKCYDMDLVAENREHENQAMQAHLTTLAYNYLNRTHRIDVRQKADGKTTEPYINEAADDAEKAANEQARNLFFGTELSMQQELYKIVSSVGFGYTQRILDFTTELRQKLLTQREKLKEFYALCGLGNVSGLLDPVTGMPNDVELREQEGALIHANYTSTLEHMLVTLKLSEEAIDGMASNQAEYRAYRTQMMAAETAQEKLQESQAEVADDEFVAAKDVGLISDQLSDDGLDYLEKMDFYRAVLSDVQKAYEDDQYQKYDKISVSWEDYMKELLNAISPDNAVNQQERSFEQFCKLAQINVSIMNEEQVTELRNRLSEIDRVVDLELLIVEYKLKTAEYQSSPYQNEYSEFQDKTFEEETERVKAAQSAGFHEIIVKLAADAEKEQLLDGTDWESEMKDIVAVCGSGIVWDPDTAELFTEESSG